MAVLYAEGFDDGHLRGTTGGNVAPSIQTTTPRTGSRSLRAQTSAASQSSFYDIDFTATTTGFAYTSFFTSALGQWIVQFIDTATGHLILRVRGDGRFELSRGTTPVLATGTFAYLPSTWVHLAMKWTIADSGGLFQLRINGGTTPDIDFSGDTRNGANAQVTKLRLGVLDGGVNSTNVGHYFDDVIVQDTTGSAPENDWLGDVQLDYVFPDGDGDDQQWTIGGTSAAPTRYESIDEVPADDGTTLIESNTVGQRNLSTFGNLPTAFSSASFIAAMTVGRMAKQSATARGVKQAAKVSGTGALGNEHTLTTSYVSYAHIFHDDPSGNQWTDTNFNGAQFGVEVTT